MTKNRKDNHNRQSESHSNHPAAEKKSKDPKEEPVIPLPSRTNFPEEPDENPDPASPEPGVDEPEKDDPTRIDEEPPIFNNY